MRKVAVGVLGAAALAFVATSANAQLLAGPPKAKGIKGELVNGYELCTTPPMGKKTNPPISLPACTTVPADIQCALDDAKGKGKWQAKIVQKGTKGVATLDVGTRDVQVKASIGGIRGTCINETLTLASDTIVSTDDCTTGDCTIVPLFNFPVGECKVAAAGTLGKCGVKGTVEGHVQKTAPGADIFKVGKRYSISILGTNVRHGGASAMQGGVILQP